MNTTNHINSAIYKFNEDFSYSHVLCTISNEAIMDLSNIINKFIQIFGHTCMKDIEKDLNYLWRGILS